MTCRPRSAWRTWLASALVALAAALPATAQQGQAKKSKVRVPPHGVQGFTLLLHHFKLQPVASFEDLEKVDPKETVVIVFGEPSPLARFDPGAFVGKGGALLVATDRKTDQLLQDFEVEVVGNVVFQDRKGYKGKRECPVFTPSERRHPLLQRVERLAAISPSNLEPKGRVLFLSRLVHFPDGCSSTERVTPFTPFIMGSDATSKHRVLVVGGHSVFMNVLMAQNDLDNFTFAVDSVRWLTDQGRRKHCLFVVDETVASTYDVPLGGIPVPTVKLVNQILHHMEQEGLFDQIVQAFVPRNFVLQVLFYGTTLFLAIYIFWRVWAKRHEVPREAPLLSAKVAQTVPDRTLMALRQQALMHEDNLWEVARSLARQCFERNGQGGTTLPIVRSDGRSAERRARQRRVLAVWKLAFGPPGRTVRARDFAKVLADVEALDEWLNAGLVRLEFPPRPDGPRSAQVAPDGSPN